MKKNKLILILILIIVIIIGTYIILNPTKTTPQEIESGIQIENIKITDNNEKYEIHLTVTEELRKNNISQINIEFYDNKAILYRKTIPIGEENNISYELSKSLIKSDLRSILFTSIDNHGKVIGTSVTYL